MLRLVLVEWLDSRQPEPNWQRFEDVDYLDSCDCVSVGFVVRETVKEFVLAPNVADIEDSELSQGSGFITIPKCSIKNVADLERLATSSQKLVTVSS